MSVGSKYWTTRLSEWPAGKPARDGYSLLLPVPGDLPVFLELALTVCAQQQSDHRVETIVIPDKPTRAVSQIVRRRSPGWQGTLRTVPLPNPERYVLPRLNNPFRNYGLQFITGVSAAEGSHVVLHDADLFMLEQDFLDRHFVAARDRHLVASGVSRVWDDWFAEHGYEICATWELCLERSWARSFPPSMHMGHTAELHGRTHGFDVTLRPQALSDPRRIGIGLGDDTIVHFNHVIGTYRRFQQSSGPFLDSDFRLLLIALFIELFAQEPFDYDLPRVDELWHGIRDSQARITYPETTSTEHSYNSFREKLERLLAVTWMDENKIQEIRTALDPFDTYYTS